MSIFDKLPKSNVGRPSKKDKDKVDNCKKILRKRERIPLHNIQIIPYLHPTPNSISKLLNNEYSELGINVIVTKVILPDQNNRNKIKEYDLKIKDDTNSELRILLIGHTNEYIKDILIFLKNKKEEKIAHECIITIKNFVTITYKNKKYTFIYNMLIPENPKIKERSNSSNSDLFDIQNMNFIKDNWCKSPIKISHLLNN